MPRPDGSVRLPTDMPPSKRVTGPAAANQAGIHTSGSAGTVGVPLYAVPWNPWDSSAFGSAESSIAATNLGNRPGVAADMPGTVNYADPTRGPGSPFPIGKSGNGNRLFPKWVVAINSYSPIAHRNPAALRDNVPPRAISARGVAVPTQRPRPYAPGYVTAWPQVAPRWPSFRESPRAGG